MRSCVCSLLKFRENLNCLFEVFLLGDVKGSLLVFLVAGENVDFLYMDQIVEHVDISSVHYAQVEKIVACIASEHCRIGSRIYQHLKDLKFGMRRDDGKLEWS